MRDPPHTFAGNWSRVAELVKAAKSRQSGLPSHLAKLIEAEAEIELFLESQGTVKYDRRRSINNYFMETADLNFWLGTGCKFGGNFHVSQIHLVMAMTVAVDTDVEAGINNNSNTMQTCSRLAHRTRPA